MGTKNEEKENLYESSDSDIKFEETAIPNNGNGRSRSFRGSIWTLPPDGFSIYRRTINDKLSDVVYRVLGFFKKGIDFLRVFVYNLYHNHKRYERKSNMSKKDIKSAEDTNNKSSRMAFDWSSVGRGIMGLGRLLLVLSIAMSSYIVLKEHRGDIVPVLIIVPMTFYAFIILATVFAKSTRKGEQ